MATRIWAMSVEFEPANRQFVRSFTDGVRLLCAKMVENARDEAATGDLDAQDFLTDWQTYFADRGRLAKNV